MIERVALVAIIIAFVIAEAVRPTTFHSKKISSRALVRATQETAEPQTATLDAELLDDLPRIHPDAPATIARTASDVITGTIVDPYTHKPGAAVFPMVDERHATDFAASYRQGRYVIRFSTDSLAHWHRVAVGLVSSDQRGYFRSERSLVLQAP